MQGALQSDGLSYSHQQSFNKKFKVRKGSLLLRGLKCLSDRH